MVLKGILIRLVCHRLRLSVRHNVFCSVCSIEICRAWLINQTELMKWGQSKWSAAKITNCMFVHICVHCIFRVKSHMLGFMRMRTVITLFMKELWGAYRRTDSLMDCWFSAVDTWKAVKVSLCFGFASIICQFGSQFRGWNGRNDWNTNDRN